MRKIVTRAVFSMSAALAAGVVLAAPAAAQKVTFGPDVRVDVAGSTVTVETKNGHVSEIYCESDLVVSDPYTGERTVYADGGRSADLALEQDWTVTAKFTGVADGQYMLSHLCYFSDEQRLHAAWMPMLVEVGIAQQPEPEPEPEPDPQPEPPATGSADFGQLFSRIFS